MKYIKKFEGITKRDKLKKNIEISEQFIPGKFIIFKLTRYSWKEKRDMHFLIISQIINALTFDGKQILKSRLVDYEYEVETLDTSLNTKDNCLETFINTDNFEKLYTTLNLKEATEKFEEIKNTEPYKSWEIKRASKQYNL